MKKSPSLLLRRFNYFIAFILILFTSGCTSKYKLSIPEQPDEFVINDCKYMLNVYKLLTTPPSQEKYSSSIVPKINFGDQIVSQLTSDTFKHTYLFKSSFNNSELWLNNAQIKPSYNNLSNELNSHFNYYIFETDNLFIDICASIDTKITSNNITQEYKDSEQFLSRGYVMYVLLRNTFESFLRSVTINNEIKIQPNETLESIFGNKESFIQNNVSIKHICARGCVLKSNSTFEEDLLLKCGALSKAGSDPFTLDDYAEIDGYLYKGLSIKDRSHLKSLQVNNTDVCLLGRFTRKNSHILYFLSYFDTKTAIKDLPDDIKRQLLYDVKRQLSSVL